MHCSLFLCAFTSAVEVACPGTLAFLMGDIWAMYLCVAVLLLSIDDISSYSSNFLLLSNDMTQVSSADVSLSWTQEHQKDDRTCTCFGVRASEYVLSLKIATLGTQLEKCSVIKSCSLYIIPMHHTHTETIGQK